MTDALIRRAEHADLAAIVQLRREWTQEEHGDMADPDLDENLAAWFARESSRRIMWLAGHRHRRRPAARRGTETGRG